MKHAQHDIFISAIHSKNKLRVTFHSQKSGTTVTRDSAPMDFGPRTNDAIRIDRYHFWDFTSPSGPHTESLRADQIQSIFCLNDVFDPADFVTWRTNWNIHRDWGRLS
ncbi:hypothetical protein BZL54_05030 [Burkholderia ubonensis subsp. mesacidophila]|uniref:Uncharacterized protein n=1 Tax=Burkholderia ubonensis subsp. mesacidophila TaxID=265293 RepID=A0A2A4FIN6_9BURK|nr:hypothetical protein BZL54_05030 [Burkholderia ubonensis subsp. mesacidophila]